SGPIRIGQGIEFDYCSVHAAWSLREAGVRAVLVNSNPETVSTDFDTSDRLYFDPLDIDGAAHVAEAEHVAGALVQFGGQTAINLAEPLAQRGVPVMGSAVEAIDLAEDRRAFAAALDAIGIPQPVGGRPCTRVTRMRCIQHPASKSPSSTTSSITRSASPATCDCAAWSTCSTSSIEARCTCSR